MNFLLTLRIRRFFSSLSRISAKYSPSGISPIINAIGISQNDYFLKNGRYWQGLKIPNDIPEDVGLSFDETIKPYYQKEGWGDLISDLPEMLPIQVEVHQHLKPSTDGTGYVIYFRKKEKGKEYMKSVAYGKGLDMESFNKDWYEIIKEQ